MLISGQCPRLNESESNMESLVKCISSWNEPLE